MSRTYVYPQFSTLGAFGFRAGGPGLGNLFFPYARALLLAKQHHFALVNPSWPTIKLGTFLRRERDKRLYVQVFRPRGIAGPKKTFLLLARRKITEEAAAKGAVPPGAVVLTAGLKNFFKDIAHERAWLAEEFQGLLRREDAARIRATGPLSIGVHARMGDFEARRRIPLAWYIQTIIKIRRAAGVRVPVAVASDGSDAELAELLRLSGVRRLRLGPAGELFALSGSKILLASDSTFSAWAAFQGHVPVVWARRGAELEGIFTDGTFDEVIAADEELPPRLAEYLRRAFR